VALKEKPEPIANRLLAALPNAEYQRLTPHFQRIHLPKNGILGESGDEARHAYFLNDGMASLLAITENGQTVDLCTIGNEGFIGLPIIQKVPFMPCRVVTQLPCDALMIKSEQLIVEFNRAEALHKLLLKYAYVQEAQIIQSVVCHSLHTIRQRLCRWLLIISDCLQSESFEVTQEHIANMLGHQRNRITLAARELLQQGLVEYGGGSMKVVDRSGLEAAACECYQIVRDNVSLYL
jgi:CRP-like cAMP-binding protein